MRVHTKPNRVSLFGRFSTFEAKYLNKFDVWTAWRKKFKKHRKIIKTNAKICIWIRFRKKDDGYVSYPKDTTSKAARSVENWWLAELSSLWFLLSGKFISECFRTISYNYWFSWNSFLRNICSQILQIKKLLKVNKFACLKEQEIFFRIA